MKSDYQILIADRNPHVRDFLRREMTAEGYQVRIAESGRQVLKWVYQREPVDLLILDPDLPDVEECDLFHGLHDRIPPLPIVVHGFPSDYEGCAGLLNTAVFIEKRGSSIERLKQVVHSILKTEDDLTEETKPPGSAPPATSL